MTNKPAKSEAHTLIFTTEELQVIYECLVSIEYFIGASKLVETKHRETIREIMHDILPIIIKK